MGLSKTNLFYGPDNKAKKKWIEEFIQKEKPRFVHTFGDSQPVGIGDVREIIRRAWLSVGSGIQLFIVERSDEMTREAQNAFLKLLEEPPSGAFFILNAESEEPLLETLRSRLAKFPFFDKDYETALKLDVNDRESAEQFFDAEIGRLKKELEGRVRENDDWKVLTARLQKCIHLHGLLKTSRVSPRYFIDTYSLSF